MTVIGIRGGAVNRMYLPQGNGEVREQASFWRDSEGGWVLVRVRLERGWWRESYRRESETAAPVIKAARELQRLGFRHLPSCRDCEESVMQGRVPECY